MNVIRTTGLTSTGIDVLKGVLILFIIAGHNPLLTVPFPGLFEVLYSFHVTGFLLLPFWFGVPELSWPLARDRAVRYLVPHYVFYLSACVLFALTFGRVDVGQLVAALAGALVGSADTVKAGSGLSLFWFLPSLLTLTLLRSAARTGRAASIGVLVLALAVHLSVGSWPEVLRVWVPFGLPIALFIFPLGVLLAWGWPRYVAPHLRAWGVGAALVWMAASVYIYHVRSPFNIGELSLFGLDRPGRLLLHDVNMLAAFVALAALCTTALGRVEWLASLGRASLIVYLLHSFVFQALLRGTTALGAELGLGVGLLLFSITVAVSYALAHWLLGLPVFARWVTPRAAADWPPTARAAQPLHTR